MHFKFIATFARKCKFVHYLTGREGRGKLICSDELRHIGNNRTTLQLLDKMELANGIYSNGIEEMGNATGRTTENRNKKIWEFRLICKG